MHNKLYYDVLYYDIIEDMLRVCSGERSVGENAGHSQVSEKAEVLLRYHLQPNASVQWQPGDLTIHAKEWFLGAGFLGAPRPFLLQVSIWREWAQDGPAAEPRMLELGELDGPPLALKEPSGERAAAEAAVVLAAAFDAAGPATGAAAAGDIPVKNK